ncbi:hypothetical protein LV75_006124 [Actinokineospora diospyrosa]|uniref:Papain like cysteine protease AvrRpt2 n=2 Tax=Actinokineospora diospyrosa TaxID=103728 RepID=A0ABT1ILR4_9PSEU|nr:hypothetical protein [Actinokineospora diospyrosa]
MTPPAQSAVPALPAKVPDQPPSALVEHPDCVACADTRSWLLAHDRAEATPAREWDTTTFGLGWLFRYFRWGPSRWPFAWCDVPGAAHLDCGVLACVAGMVLTARGLRVERVQLVERAAVEETALWRARWRAAGCPAGWILSDREVYHEVLLVHAEPEPVLFDPTELRQVGQGRDRPLWMRKWVW